MRRFIIVVIVLGVLGGLLVIADRVTCGIAQREIASKIQTTEGLSARPGVKVHGFPFLTQALGGRYQRIDADAADLTVDSGLTVDTLHVELQGLHVKLADLLSGSVPDAPVDSAVATATMGYPSLDAVAKANLADQGLKLKFGPGQGNQLAVAGTYSSGGLTAKIKAQAKVIVKQGNLVVRVVPSSLVGVPTALRAQVISTVGSGYQIPRLPFGFEAKTVTVGPSGVSVRATATSVGLG